MLQLLGDDWAPEGYEQWRNAHGVLGAPPRDRPARGPGPIGLRHLVECVEAGRPTVIRPEHAYHALEVMLAAQAAGAGRAARVEIESTFPALGLRARSPPPTERRAQEPRPEEPGVSTDVSGQPPKVTYAPSPRPSFDGPTLHHAAPA